MSLSRKQFSAVTAFLLIMLCYGPVPAQQTDTLENYVLSGIDSHVQWCNLRNGPRWLEGPLPVYHKNQALHIVVLDPGKTITLRLERNEILRGLSPDEPFKTGDVIISRSNGTGLHMDLEPLYSGDSKSFLVFPVWRTGSIIKITRPQSFETSKWMSLFVSEDTTPKPLLDYHRPIKCPGKVFHIRRIDEASTGLYTFLDANREVDLELGGPLRLRLETRLKYPPATGQTRQSFHIHTVLNDQPYKSLSFKTTFERRFPVMVKGKSQVLSRIRHSYLNIPEGKHKLSLKSTAPIYITLSSLKISNKKPESTGKILELLKDVRYRETGLTGAASMAEYDDGVAAADTWNQHTFYRPVQPWEKQERKFPRVSTVFLRKQLKPLAKHQRARGKIIDEQFREDDLETLPRGDFSPLTGEMTYYVPELNAPSSLRVAVLKQEANEPVGFDVYIGNYISNDTPHPLTFYPEPEVPEEELEISPARWADEVEHKAAAYVEIPLPPRVPIIRLKRRESNDPVSPLYVALAYRASRPFALSEFDYSDRIQKYGRIEWFKYLCTDEASFPDRGFAAHHMPLLRFLRARLRGFQTGITSGTNIGRVRPFPNQNQKIKQEALAWEEQGQWLNALETWSRAGDMKGRIRALLALDEFFLAEVTLKGLILHEQNQHLRKWALKRLYDFYRSMDQDEKLLALHAAEAYLHPTEQSLKNLAVTLKENEEFEFARQISMFTGNGGKGEQWKSPAGKDIWSRGQDYQIKDCAGFAVLYSPERDLYGDYARVTMQRPLDMEIRGPVELKLEIRPLHHRNNGNEPAPVNTWLRLTLDGKEYPVAVSNNRPTIGLQLTGPESRTLLPGTRIEKHLNLGPGNHRIGQASHDLPLLVRFTKGKKKRLAKLHDKMAGLLREAERQAGTHPDAADVLLAKASHLYHQTTQKDDTLYSLYSRLKTPRRWEPVTPVIHSAGLLPVTIVGWKPESPYMRTRQALLPPLKAGEMLLSPDKQIDTVLTIPEEREFKLFLSPETPDFLEQHPISLEIHLNGSLFRTVTLDPQQHTKPERIMLRLNLKAGNHALSFVSTAGAANHFVRIGFAPAIERELTRYYHTASALEPLHIRVPGGSWLRVEELENNRSNDSNRTSYLFVPPGRDGKADRDVFLAADGKISFSPPAKTGNTGKPRLAFYRIFRQRVQQMRPGVRTQSNIPPAAVKPELTPLPLPEYTFKAKTSSAGFTLIDGLSPGGQEKPSWSLRMSRFNRLPFLEESVIDGDGYRDKRDSFLQWTLTRRFFNPVKNHYWKTELFLRHRDLGGATVGAGHRWWFRPVGSRLFFDLKGTGFVQGIRLDERILNIRGGTPDYRRKMAWSIHLQGQVRLRQTIGRILTNRPGLRLFGRFLSTGGTGLPLDAVIDFDVYSGYKKDHRFGFTLEDILLFRPWQSSRLWLGLSVTTNESLNPLSPDYSTLQGGWKQFYRWVQFDVSYRWRRYYKDKDRPYIYDSHVLTARLGMDVWTENRRRLEIGMMVSREWLLKKNNFSFFVAWHLGKGRGYRDFNSAELDFKGLKERQLVLQRGLKTNVVKR